LYSVIFDEDTGFSSLQNATLKLMNTCMYNFRFIVTQFHVPLSSRFVHDRRLKWTLYSMSEKFLSWRILWQTKTKEFYEQCSQHWSIIHSSCFKHCEARWFVL